MYAPTSDAGDEEIEEFYESLAETVRVHRKSGECLVIMGDFNGKVGSDCEGDTVGPFGLGQSK